MADILFGGIFSFIPTTLSWRARNTTSIGNLMPTVCTPLQERMRRASPSARPRLPISPFIRAAIPAATSTLFANSLPLLALKALIFYSGLLRLAEFDIYHAKLEDYNQKKY